MGQGYRKQDKMIKNEIDRERQKDRKGKEIGDRKQEDRK